MAKSRRSSRSLAAAISRKNPQTIQKETGQALERARQQIITAGLKSVERERELLLAEIKARPKRAARLKRALSVAEGDINLGRTAELALTRVARPDPKGLLLAGQVEYGKVGRARITLIFTDADCRALEGAPEIAVDGRGVLAHLVTGSELTALQKAVGKEGSAFVGLKIGRRVVATTSQPLDIRVGATLQFSLKAP